MFSALKSKERIWLTGSNLAYPVAGLWSEDPFFAGMMLVLGLSSAFYHAGGKHGNHIDVAAVYAVVFFIIGVLWGIPPVFIVPGALAGGAVLRKFTLDIPMEHKVGAITILLLLFGFLSGAPLVLPAAVLAVALAIRQWVDHGAWHILSAYGLALAHRALS